MKYFASALIAALSLVDMGSGQSLLQSGCTQVVESGDATLAGSVCDDADFGIPTTEVF